MNESFDKVEKDLAALRPRALPRELVERVTEELDRPPVRWADRVLASFVGAGALAACVIVGVVTWNVIAPNESPQQPTDLTSFTPASLAAYQQMLARGASPPPGMVDPLSAIR